MADTFLAILNASFGVVLLFLGANLSINRWIRSGGRFDLTMGAVFMLLAVLTVSLGIYKYDGGYSHYSLYLVHFLLGLVLFRTYVVLTPDSERRPIDRFHTAILIVPSGCSMVGSFSGLGLLQWVGLLAAIPASLFGLVSILYAAVRLARGKRVYKRDVVAPIAVVPLPYIYLTFLLTGVNFPT